MYGFYTRYYVLTNPNLKNINKEKCQEQTFGSIDLVDLTITLP